MPTREIALVVVLLACVVALFFAPPVFVVREPGAIDPADYLFAIRNPFRNRDAEKAAVALLEELRAGRCTPVVATCERERELRLQSWELSGREDDGTQSKLRYRVKRLGDSVAGSVSITVAREGDAYRVTQYSAAY